MAGCPISTDRSVCDFVVYLLYSTVSIVSDGFQQEYETHFICDTYVMLFKQAEANVESSESTTVTCVLNSAFVCDC